MEDHNAIARLKRGDIGGLAALVERYQVRAVRAAYLITQDRALAEDVVQAAFLRVYQRIGQFDAARPFRPWFMRSVVNAAVQAAQRQSEQLSLDADAASGLDFADLLPDPTPGPDAAERAESEQVVRAALRKLPPPQRAAVVLRYYLDMDEREIAQALDTAPGTVRWRLHAARKQLRGLLGLKEA